MSAPRPRGGGARPASASFRHHRAITAALPFAAPQDDAEASAPTPTPSNRLLREQIDAG